MTDLKPRRGCCEYCVSCLGAENCRQCGATLTPVPELPEGYREKNGTLYSRFSKVATWHPNGRIKASTNYKHAKALAIWLQRRSK